MTPQKYPALWSVKLWWTVLYSSYQNTGFNGNSIKVTP